MANWKRILTTSDFSDSQIQDLQELVFTSPTVSLTVSPTSFEKGVQTDVEFEFTATQGNDTFIASSGELFTGANNITDDDLGASGTITVNNAVDNVSRKFRANFTQEGTISTANKVSQAITPQYVGVSTLTSFNDSTYTNINNELSKFLSTQNFINSTNAPGTNLANSTIGFSAEGHYIYFISKNSGLIVYDQTNLPQSMVTEFEETTISVELANGTDQTMYQYRSVKAKNFSTEAGGQIGYKLASA